MLLNIVIASILGGVLSLAGGAILLWRENFARRFSLVLVSFAAGSLIGAAFLELLPEAVAERSFEELSPVVIAGILSVFLLEKVLNWYHCHDPGKCDVHPVSELPATILFGDAMHNFIDGIVIALSFSVSVPAGIATTIAIFFHEIPQEIGDFGVLLHAGYSKAKVLVANFLVALFNLAGALVGYFFLAQIGVYVPFMLAFAAGMFIYIAVSDLLPELRHRVSNIETLHLLTLLLGILAIKMIGVYLPE